MSNRAKKLFFVSFCIALTAITLLLPDVSSAETIAKINITGLTTLSEDTVRNVIPIKPGDEFSTNKLDIGIGYLRKWGVFESVEAVHSMMPEGVVIDIHLKQATVIESIYIAGNYPFVETKIRKYLNIHAGDIYSPDKIAEQTKRIIKFYKQQGFVGTEVYVAEEERPDVDGVSLTFHIRRGQVLRYRTIEVRGNKAFPAGRFISKINTWRPYSERRLQDAIRGLREFYQRHGYPRARIKLAGKEFDFEKNRVDITIDVSEGPKVKLKFRGSRHTSRRLLRKAVTVFKNGSVDDFELGESADGIKDIMHRFGYPDATVTWKKYVAADGIIYIVFDINEGAPKRIRHLGFQGDIHVNEGEIKNNMRNRQMAMGRRGAFFPEQVESDNETIMKALSKQGYRDAKVGQWIVGPTPQGHALDIKVPIEEGRQTKVSSVKVNGNTVFDEGYLFEHIVNRPGASFDEEGLAGDRQKILELYANNGRPYAEAEALWSKNMDGDADVLFEIREDTEVRIGRILIVGDVLTSQKAIRKAMSIREGELFSYVKIIESQLNIRRLGPFSAVNIETIGLEDHQPIVHLRVKVEEQKPFRVDLEASYSTAQQYTGSFIFTNLNSFGWAKTNTLKLTGGKDLSRAEIGWIDPRFLGSSFEMSDFGWVQYKHRPAYTTIQMGGSFGWLRRFRKLGLLARYELDRNYFVEGNSTAADADSLRNNTISKITLSGSYDSRDNFSYPTRGFFTQGGADIFNEIKGNHANFVKFNWRGETDLSFLKIFTLSTLLRLDRIETIGKNISVPTNELLFLGGDDTIRGFGEDSLGPVDAAGKATGSRSRWIVNEEMRIRIWRALSWAFFYDMGCLTSDFSDVSWWATRKSAGFGLRYTTPVGPIRADYGLKLDRREGEPVGRFHFTFGYLF